MKKLLLITIVISASIQVHAQKFSTVFIDSLLIVYRNDTIVSDSLKRVFIVENFKPNKINIYNNEGILVDLHFGASNSNNLTLTDINNIDVTQPTFIFPLSLLSFSANSRQEIFEEGLIEYGNGKFDMFDVRSVFRNWDRSEPLPPSINMVEVWYRLTNSAPLEPTCYPYHHREGEWIKINLHGDTVRVNFKNDKRHGFCTVTKPNNAWFEAYFRDGERLTEIRFYNSKGIRKKNTIYTYPSELSILGEY
ncbi:MAG: hypothetical protein K8R53_07305 [Bacteroidales bacterium]|nr:hypothetical protein [Bacteroidales bacterium]